MTTIQFPPAPFAREIGFPCPVEMLPERAAVDGVRVVIEPMTKALRWVTFTAQPMTTIATLHEGRADAWEWGAQVTTRTILPADPNGTREIRWERDHLYGVTEVWSRTYNATHGTLQAPTPSIPWMPPRTSLLRRWVTPPKDATPTALAYARWVHDYGYVGRIAGDRVPCYGPLRSNVRVDPEARIADHMESGARVGAFWPMTENWTGSRFGTDPGGPGGAWIEPYPGLSFDRYSDWWRVLQRTEDRLSIQHRDRAGEPAEVAPGRVRSERYSLDRNNDDLSFLPDGTEYLSEPGLPAEYVEWHGRTGNHGWDQAHLIRQIRAALVLAYQANDPAAIDSLRMSAMDAAYGYCPYEPKEGNHGRNPYYMLRQSLWSRLQETKPPFTIRGTGWSLFAMAAALDFGSSEYLTATASGIRRYLEQIRLPCGLHQYGKADEPGYAPPPSLYGGKADERFAQSLEVPIVLAGLVAAELVMDGKTSRATWGCLADTITSYITADWKKWLRVEKAGKLSAPDAVAGLGPVMNEPNAWLASELAGRVLNVAYDPPGPPPWTYQPNRAWCAGVS